MEMGSHLNLAVKSTLSRFEGVEEWHAWVRGVTNRAANTLSIAMGVEPHSGLASRRRPRAHRAHHRRTGHSPATPPSTRGRTHLPIVVAVGRTSTPTSPSPSTHGRTTRHNHTQGAAAAAAVDAGHTSPSSSPVGPFPTPSPSTHGRTHLVTTTRRAQQQQKKTSLETTHHHDHGEAHPGGAPDPSRRRTRRRR